MPLESFLSQDQIVWQYSQGKCSFTAAMVSSHMPWAPTESTMQDLSDGGPKPQCICWHLTHMYGSCYYFKCREKRKEGRESKDKGKKVFSTFKKCLHPQNWAVGQENSIYKHLQEELGKILTQFKAQLKPHLLAQAFSKFPSTAFFLSSSLSSQYHLTLSYSAHSGTQFWLC